jgi:hypothetical protein
MSIETAITKLQSYATSAGAKEAPSQPPEQPGVFPFSICYEREADTVQDSSAFGDDLVTIWLEYHVSRTLLKEAILAAATFRSAFLIKLRDNPTLEGTVSTINGPVHRTFGTMKWGGLDTIGYRFEIPVKVHV